MMAHTCNYTLKQAQCLCSAHVGGGHLPVSQAFYGAPMNHCLLCLSQCGGNHIKWSAVFGSHQSCLNSCNLERRERTGENGEESSLTTLIPVNKNTPLQSHHIHLHENIQQLNM